MDLSKAFDCLPHILLDKLSAYGVSSQSVSLLKSYLSNRKMESKKSFNCVSITFSNNLEKIGRILTGL
jgi:hypothetical protein